MTQTLRIVGDLDCVHVSIDKDNMHIIIYENNGDILYKDMLKVKKKGAKLENVVNL